MKVVFNENKHHAYTRGLYRYDFGQTLEIEGLDLPSILQIDFALDKKMGGAISMDAYTDEENITHVNIPDSLLGDGGKPTNYSIWAYIFVADEEKGETVAFIQMDVNARPKGGGHDTPEERPYFEQIIAQVKEYRDSAREAESGAQEAKEDAETAKTGAETARAGAVSAAAFAIAAKNDASGFADAAEISAGRANTAMSEAEASAQTATTASQTATTQANKAESEAQKAEGYKTASETAQSLAEAARNEAVQAKNDAETARNEATSAVSGFTALVEQKKAEITTEGERVLATIPEDYHVTVEKVSQLEERVDNVDEVIIDTVEPLQKQADRTEDKLDALWKLSEGQVYDFVEKEESGMNEAPSGAKYMTAEEVYGKTEQDNTNGYQLLPLVDGVSVNPSRGVSFTVEDGYIILNGTYSGSRDNVVFLLKDLNIPLKAGTYYEKMFGRYKGEGMQVITSDGVSRNISMGANEEGDISYTTVVNEDTTISFIYFNMNPSRATEIGTFVNYKVAIMLTSVNNATFEPYTGGIPSPNPDYPQEIKSVEEVNVKVVGANLCNNEELNSNNYNMYTKKTLLFPGIYYVCRFNNEKELNRVASNGRVLFSADEESGAVTLTTSKDGVYVASGLEEYGYINDAFGYNATKAVLTILKPVWVSTNTQWNSATPKGNRFYFVIRTDDYATTWLPEYDVYTEQNHTIIPPRPLNAIGEYRDKMDIVNGVWEWNTNEYTFTGNEVWSVQSGYDSTYKTPVSLNTTEQHDAVCEFAQSVKTFGQAQNMDYAYIARYSNQINVKNVGVSDASELNQIVKDKSVVYVTKNPTTEPISTADLAWLKENLYDLSADHHVTITDQNGNDVSCLVEYIRKLSEV